MSIIDMNDYGNILSSMWSFYVYNKTRKDLNMYIANWMDHEENVPRVPGCAANAGCCMMEAIIGEVLEKTIPGENLSVTQMREFNAQE